MIDYITFSFGRFSHFKKVNKYYIILLSTNEKEMVKLNILLEVMIVELRTFVDKIHRNIL